MPKASPLQSNFTGGEFSALTSARVDAERYRNGLETCKNYIPLIQGPVSRRPGTYFVGETKGSAKARLVPFEFSTTQAYMLEFSDLAIRFYKDRAQILESAQNISSITQATPGVFTVTGHGYSTGDYVYLTGISGMTVLNGRVYVVFKVTNDTFRLTDSLISNSFIDTSALSAASGGTVARLYTLTTTYAEADLFQLEFTQSTDTVYITHPNYAPRKLTRTGHTSWTLSTIDFLDGPYITPVTSGTTLTTSGGTGIGASVTVTASNITNINGGTGFQTTDVGRLIRLQNSATSIQWVKITAYTSTTVVTAVVKGTSVLPSDPKAYTTWALGLWSDTTGYPACSTFHEDRLCFFGSKAAPQRVDCSRSGDYENFALTDPDGTVPDDAALAFTMNSSSVNAGNWLISGEKGLFAGTRSSEWIVRPSVQGEALTPGNIKADEISGYGSKQVTPVKIGNRIFFVQRTGKIIRELGYEYESEGAKAPNRTIVAPHITKSGIVQMAHQKEPQSIVWCVRTDGVLAAMTYEREEDSLTVGWHRHVLGGVDANGNPAIVESVAIIPSPDGDNYDVWFSVKRYVDNEYRRYVEYLTRIFDSEEGTDQQEAICVDSALTYDNPVDIEEIDVTVNPPVVSSTAHGLSDGDRIRIDDLYEYGGALSRLSGKDFIVANKTTDEFELANVPGASIDLNFTDEAPISPPGFTFGEGSVFRKYVTEIGGLYHLAGQTVSICADGAPQNDQEVERGASTPGYIGTDQGTITLDQPAVRVHVGLAYQSDLKMLRLEAGAADGTARGKLQRTHKLGIMFKDMGAFSYGTDFDDMYTEDFRTPEDSMSEATPLFSGIWAQEFESDYSTENQLCIRQDTPVPGTILAIGPQLHTEDAA